MSTHPSPSAASESIGLDQQAVQRWFEIAVPSARAPLSFELLAGGYSNLTYRVIDQGSRSWVLRRPPTGELRPGAHSMEREWRILSALQTSAVPVPPTAAFCADPGVTGAEFYVMDHVEGIVVDSEAKAVVFTPDARRRLSDDLVTTLVELHRVDPGVVGRRRGAQLGSYVGKQLELWMRQINDGGVPRTSEIVEVHHVLRERMPPQRWNALTHGDFRLGNVLATEAGQVAAVLDWELWTVGDPLADLGWLAAWWNLDSDDGWSPGRAEGFPAAEEIADEYQRLTGRDTSDVSYYIGFALWRLACISEGVYARYAAGMMGRPPIPLEALAARPRKLAVAARAALH